MLARQTARVATLMSRRHLVKHVSVAVIGTRNICTNDSQNMAFEAITVRRNVELSPNPFENIAIRRYTTHEVEDEYESPNPFENIAKVRRPKLAPNVVASPFVDVLIPDSCITEYVWKHVDQWSNHTAIVSDDILSHELIEIYLEKRAIPS